MRRDGLTHSLTPLQETDSRMHPAERWNGPCGRGVLCRHKRSRRTKQEKRNIRMSDNAAEEQLSPEQATLEIERLRTLRTSAEAERAENEARAQQLLEERRRTNFGES